jgi:hypothetical protein
VTRRARSRAARRGLSSVALFFMSSCVMLLALGALLMWHMRAPGDLHAPPEVTDPDQPIEAFVARHAQAGGIVVAQLAPLHADSRQQAFEAGALRKRFELDQGEPWRLNVRLEGDASAAPVELRAVEVSDEHGVALRTLESGAQPTEPVHTLFAPPSGELRSGEAAQWVLWGRSPQAGARVVGLLDEPLALESGSLRRSELTVPLARLDRPRTSGKNGAQGASETSHGEPDAVKH